MFKRLINISLCTFSNLWGRGGGLIIHIYPLDKHENMTTVTKQLPVPSSECGAEKKKKSSGYVPRS